ncbi:MAG: ABC transporter permease [Euryarchaeota archaeon]|nr:ABC transporter permease [Euryarchaeota archaeon]
MIGMPLFFTSTARMPYDKMSGWLKTIASVNPVSHAINSVRMLRSRGNVAVSEILMLGAGATIVLRDIYLCVQNSNVIKSLNSIIRRE